MRAYRKGIIVWCLMSALLFAALPAVNWIFSGGTIPLADTGRLFSLDLAHSYINRFLYRQGISGNSRRVVVGRQGWLFLGNHYDQVMDKTRGIEVADTAPARMAASVRELKQRQDWLTGKGIMSLFVIAPNKHTTYSEFLPWDDPPPVRNFTDEFIARARSVDLNLLDLRPIMLKARSGSEPLYFETDSHWNAYGAYLGYRATLAAVNELYGAQIQALTVTTQRWVARGAGDLARLLKFDTLLDKDVDRDVHLSYQGSDAILCIQKLDIARLAPRGRCQKSRNRILAVHAHPQASFNQQALNRMNVLWLRDSFGNGNSKFYQQTFSRIWEVDYKHFANLRWREVIGKLHPDLVIYQVAEREIHGPAFRPAAAEPN